VALDARLSSGEGSLSALLASLLEKYDTGGKVGDYLRVAHL